MRIAKKQEIQWEDLIRNHLVLNKMGKRICQYLQHNKEVIILQTENHQKNFRDKEAYKISIILEIQKWV